MSLYGQYFSSSSEFILVLSTEKAGITAAFFGQTRKILFSLNCLLCSPKISKKYTLKISKRKKNSIAFIRKDREKNLN